MALAEFDPRYTSDQILLLPLVSTVPATSNISFVARERVAVTFQPPKKEGRKERRQSSLLVRLDPTKRETIHRFYRLRSKTNSSLRPTIIMSKVIASTVLMSTILRSTQNDLHQNCFYIINVYRS